MIIKNKHSQNSENKFKKNSHFHKYIFKVGNTYQIKKNINGKNKYFKSFDNLSDAIDYRDKLIANNWEKLPLTQEEIYEKNYKEYYKGLTRTNNGRRYQINNINGDYLATIKGLEEALYYRDKFYYSDKSKAPRPNTIDLTTNNIYLDCGLEYPIPERLIPFKNSTYGEGRIVKKGEFSYAIEYGKKENCYICSCRTYEQAWYVQKEMNKCGWDKAQLQKILDNYPLWYTKLMEFYRYIHLDYDYKNKTGKEKYKINIPREYLEDGKNLEQYHGYTNIEDALHERDFLVEHDWDYDELVEAIDDTKNPYYNMDLPPYPQRKILNLKERDYHEKELTRVYELINNDQELSQEEICEIIGVGPVTLRNWLRNFWNSNYNEFIEIALTGENPINVLEKVPLIYQPDLSRPKPANFKGYIQYSSRDKRSPYKVVKDGVRYGSYYTEKQAKKAVSKLKQCNWDKNKVSEIQKSVGWKPLTKRGNIYPVNTGGWMIRRKNKDRKMVNYGFYKDYDLAVIVRDMLILNDWNKDEYPSIRSLAEEVLYIQRLLYSNMFAGEYDYIYLEGLCLFDRVFPVLSDDDSKHVYYNKAVGRYSVQKYINGSVINFGYYDSKEEALQVRELLIDNNWDKDVLDLVKEVGL